MRRELAAAASAAFLLLITPVLRFASPRAAPTCDGCDPSVQVWGRRQAGSVAWQVQPNGSITATGPPHLTLSEAQQCLANRHIVFAGDSILRYTYMALVLWLHTGEWPKGRVRDTSNQMLRVGTREGTGDMREGSNATADPNASVAWQREWPSWDDFFNGSSSRFGGAMCCDCHRFPKGGGAPLPSHLRKLVDKWKSGQLPSSKVRSLQVMIKQRMGNYWESQHENRFYRTPRNAAVQANLSFFFLHGDHGGFGGPVGHKEGCPGAVGGRERAGAALTNARNDILKRPRWRGMWSAVAKVAADAGDPTAFIANVGRWKAKWHGDGKRLSENAEAVEQMLKPRQGQPVFVTATQTCTGKGWRDTETADALVTRGWGLVDAHGITSSLHRSVGSPGEDGEVCAKAWVDGAGHLQPFVYREMAQALLRRIC